MPEAHVTAGSRRCPDPECPGRQEPQDDGECQWWSCETCGYDSGFTLSRQDTGACSAGVPVARQYIQEAGRGLQERDFTRPQSITFLGEIGRRPS